MMREVYELGIAYIKAYYRIEKIYNEMKFEQYKISGEIKDAVIQKGIAGNAKFENKVIDYIQVEKKCNELFNPVKMVVENWNNDSLTRLIIKSIATENHMTKFADRDLAEKKVQFTKDVAENIFGEKTINTINKYQ